MWVRDPFHRRGIDRLSPVCGALIAALLVESEVAQAAGDDAPPLLPLGSEVTSAEAPLDRGPALRPEISFVRPAPPAGSPPPSVPGSPFASDASPPIRLDAKAVLSLAEMFPVADPWRAPNPNFETAIRTLDLTGARKAPEPANEDPPPISPAVALPGVPANWFDEHIELSFDDGIAYKKNFTWRGQNLRLKIWGPVLKGDAGLGVRLRGLRLGGTSVELRARATTDLQDLQVQIAF